MNIEKSCHNFELCNATLETVKKMLACLDCPWFGHASIEQSLFPDQCKIAKLKPIFKKGSKIDPKNYRSISMLPAGSKIIDKTIQIQTQEYLDKNGLLLSINHIFT